LEVRNFLKLLNSFLILLFFNSVFFDLSFLFTIPATNYVSTFNWVKTEPQFTEFNNEIKPNTSTSFYSAKVDSFIGISHGFLRPNVLLNGGAFCRPVKTALFAVVTYLNSLL